MMHALEARRFFSAALEDGRLHVVGTSGDDRIVVELVGDGEFSTPDTYRVTVNGRQTSFATDQIKSVFIEGLGGNDKIVHGRDYPGSPFFTINSSVHKPERAAMTWP